MLKCIMAALPHPKQGVKASMVVAAVADHRGDSTRPTYERDVVGAESWAQEWRKTTSEP